MGIRKRGGCDEKEGSGRQIPMSINMPQLIFQRAESAPPLPSQMSQAALSGGKSLGEGGLLLRGGGDPRFPTPLYETLKVILGTNGKHPPPPPPSPPL